MIPGETNVAIDNKLVPLPSGPKRHGLLHP